MLKREVIIKIIRNGDPKAFLELHNFDEYVIHLLLLIMVLV